MIAICKSIKLILLLALLVLFSVCCFAESTYTITAEQFEKLKELQTNYEKIIKQLEKLQSDYKLNLTEKDNIIQNLKNQALNDLKTLQLWKESAEKAGNYSKELEAKCNNLENKINSLLDLLKKSERQNRILKIKLWFYRTATAYLVYREVD